MVERYGKPEGVIAYNVSRRFAEKVEAGELDRAEAWNEIKRELKSHPKTSEIEADILAVEEESQRHESLSSDSDSVTASDVTTSSNTFDLYLNAKTTKKSSSLNTRVQADVELGKEHLHAVSNSAAAGSGYALARMHSRYEIPETTEYAVSVEYLRDVDTILAEGQMSVYTKDQFNGVRKYPLETLKTSSGTVTRSATGIEMKAGNSYEIGVEVYAYSSTAGAVAYTDAYNCKSLGCFDGRHRVELQRPPVLRW